ncbi:MAG: trypsin-like peptidase domain-containing protein [Alphaproteobacteria bacterium]|nr:trypsin-like peptidase domain-containing protein [Alphaproteobacteria bacterium]
MEPYQTEEISILKSTWKKNEHGVWIGHDLKALELKPREGCKTNYFKIKDEINLLTERPGAIFKDIFSTFGTTEFLVRQSIVPVVAWNEGDEYMRCIGTGFFISATGLLMTAAHVLRDPVDEEYTSLTQVDKNSFRLDNALRFGVLLPANPAMNNAPDIFGVNPAIRDAKWFMAPFEWACHWGKEDESPLFHQKADFKLDIDIAICKIRSNDVLGTYQPLNIGLHNLQVGNRAIAIGYAEMNERIPFKTDEDLQPELVVSVGSVTNIYHDNITEKQSSTPGPCFDFDAKIPGKMSGSPILVGSGILTKGVVSRSLGADENHATGCLVAPAMTLELESYGGKSLLDLMNTGNEGIAKFRGPNL